MKEENRTHPEVKLNLIFFSLTHLPSLLCAKHCPNYRVANYHNKLTQIELFKSIEMYSLTVLEARNIKSRCFQRHTPSKVSRRESFLVSSSIWWLHIFLGLWLHNANFCLSLHGLLPSVSTFVFSSSVSHKNIYHWTQGPAYSRMISSQDPKVNYICKDSFYK